MGADGLNEHLLRRALSDAYDSDVVLGETVQTTSPLGELFNPEGIGMWKGNIDAGWALAFGPENVPSGFRLEAMRRGIVRWSLEGFGAAAFLRHAFIVPVREGGRAVEIEEVETEELLVDRAAIIDQLRPFGVAGLRPTLLLRVYEGSNTRVTDLTLIQRAGRWLLPRKALVRGAVLVGRVCWTVGAESQALADPTAEWRLSRATLRSLPWRAATEAPELGALEPGTLGPDTHLLVAVHGTMACAIPMAREIERIRGRNRGFLTRFEHDTWLPVLTNARSLSAAIAAVGVKRVTLVAHSRGGLVALLAMGLLRRETPDIRADLLALGTPFGGTPVITSAAGGLLGALTLIGSLETFSGMGFDLVTRLSGFVIRGQLPAGLRDMSETDSAALLLIREFFTSENLDVRAFGGRMAPDAPTDSFAVKMISGFTDRSFRGADGQTQSDNDYVVPTISALRYTAEQEVIESDHFSYLTKSEVVAALKAMEPSGARW
ncbi:pimeloyl-ACP methyl ester carboxylesterase [Microbacterium sp. W4I20]|nr:pimeloyl-ACP methyl ester carboxylesterase [Microbacterium sp. W4I20]